MGEGFLSFPFSRSYKVDTIKSGKDQIRDAIAAVGSVVAHEDDGREIIATELLSANIEELTIRKIPQRVIRQRIVYEYTGGVVS